MTDKYDCITFHTSACDNHYDRVLNVHGPDGLDDECPVCEVERLTAEVDGAWHDHGIMVEQYKYWSAEARRLRAALAEIVDCINHDYSRRDIETVAHNALAALD